MPELAKAHKEIHRLEDELDEARETIRQLKEAMKPPEGFLSGMRPLSRIILFTLARAAGPVSGTELTRRADIILGHTFDRSAVPMSILRMRKRHPQIVIKSQKWQGYWLDDESKAIVLGTEPK